MGGEFDKVGVDAEDDAEAAMERVPKATSIEDLFGDIFAAETADRATTPTTGTEGKGKSTFAKTAAKSKAKAKAKAKAAAKPVVTKRPPCPAFKKLGPVHYLSCTVYCDAKGSMWRAVEWSNRRKDVRFHWSHEGCGKCMKWCEENSKH